MSADPASGRFAYEGLDRLLHEKARLSIMSSLYAARKGLGFNDLKKLCNLTDGNLSRHISILKEAGLIKVTKGYERNKPKTRCELTAAGRRRFRDYLSELEQIIKDASSQQKLAESIADRHGFSPA